MASTKTPSASYKRLKAGKDSVSIQSVQSKAGSLRLVPKKKAICTIDSEEMKRLQRKRNTWCCIHFRLPRTGRLEQTTLAAIAYILFFDLMANLCLFMTTNKWKFSELTLNNLWSDITDFHHGTSDVVALWIFRLISMYSLSYIAVKKGVPSDLWPEKEPSCFVRLCHRRKKINDLEVRINGNVDDDDLNGSPILGSTSAPIRLEPKEKKKTTGRGGRLYTVESTVDGIVDQRKLLPTFQTKSDVDKYEQRKQRAVVTKYSVLMLMFILSTAFQGFIGIKCVKFDFLKNTPSVQWETAQAILYGIVVICINAEIFLFKSFIEAATDQGEWVLIPSLHPHPLEKAKRAAWCDLCRGRAKFYNYRCEACHFDVCSACYLKERKKLKGRQESKRKAEGEKQQSMQKGGKLRENINVKAATKEHQYQNAGMAPENDPTEEAQSNMTVKRYFITSLKLARPHTALLIVSFLCLIGNAVINLKLPEIQGKVINALAASPSPEPSPVVSPTVMPLIEPMNAAPSPTMLANDSSKFVAAIKIFVLLSALSGAIGSLNALCFSFVGRKLAVSIRSMLFGHIMMQNVQFFDDMSSGELISRMTNDVSFLLTPIRTMLSSTLLNLIYLIGGMVMCFKISWRLSMLAFTTVAPILFLIGQYAKWSRSINLKIFCAFSSSTQIATQTFGNIRTVRAFGTEKKEIQHYDNAMQEILERGLISAVAATLTFALANYLDLGANVVFLYFGGRAILYNDQSFDNLSFGKLFAFQQYWTFINNSYKGLQNVITSFTSGLSAAERVLTLLDHIGNKQHNLYSGLEPKDPEIGLDGHISIENVHFRYKTRPDNPVLEGINLDVKPGQVVAVVGRSGGGKSTLIHLLMSFYDVTSGQILYNKERMPLNEMNLTKFRSQIGFVAQETQLFDCTIRENISYGVDNTRDVTIEEVAHYARLANCHDFIAEFEEGYNTRIGERGVRLSGGQKQRIAIARMLMKKPKILFLDEATSNLDTESEALVQAAIDRTIWYRRNDNNYKYDEREDDMGFQANAVVLVAHRLSTVINADKIAVIDKGKIVEVGTHDELKVLEGGVYRKLVQRQIQKENNQLNQEEEKEDVENVMKGKVAADNIDSLFNQND